MSPAVRAFPRIATTTRGGSLSSDQLDHLREVWEHAAALMDEHLDASWSLAFDHAVTRGGACHHDRRRVSISRHIAVRTSVDAMDQIVLHEIAHARAGYGAGHGPVWLREARRIGYTGGVRHREPTAVELAPWIGTCPAGHEIARFRRPRTARSCSRCASTFRPEHVITWRRRD